MKLLELHIAYQVVSVFLSTLRTSNAYGGGHIHADVECQGCSLVKLRRKGVDSALEMDGSAPE